MSASGISSSDLTALQTAAQELVTAATCLHAALAAIHPVPATPPVPPPPTPAPGANFKPANPTPNDIYTGDATVLVPADKLPRNIICTGATPTQVQSPLEPDFWKPQPDTADGGKVWQEVHATGQILTLYFCASGIYAAPAHQPVPTPSPSPTPAPLPAPINTGAANLSGSTITPAQSPLIADGNVSVLHRLDGRIVYHLGILNPVPPADTDMTKAENLGPYIAFAVDGSSVVVPAHWWNARWTDRALRPIKIVKSPAQIVAAKRMFAFGPAGKAVIPAQGARAPYTIMGSSDVTIYEPTTGERPDIGLITDPSAYFMLGGDPGHMIDWALAGETCPIYFRDQSTDRPIDLRMYPQANSYDEPNKQGSPWLCKGPASPSSGGASVFGGGWQPQQAHHPEYCYMAFQATGDMGFLESLQYHANFVVLTNAVNSTAAGAVIGGEQRGLAWALRTLFMAHIATKDAEAIGPLPMNYMPSSYFQGLLDNARAYLTNTYLNSTDPTQATFHLVGAVQRFAPWQQDYILTALAFGVLTGHAEWATVYLFALRNAIDRLSGASGYPPGWGGSYYLNTYAWAKNADGTYNQTAFDTTKPLTWNATFLFQQSDPNGAQPTATEIAALTADPFNGGVAIEGQEYLQTTRAVIAQAQYLDSQGILAVRQTFPNLDACFVTVDKMVQNSGVMEPRHAITSAPNVAPTVIVPYKA